MSIVWAQRREEGIGITNALFRPAPALGAPVESASPPRTARRRTLLSQGAGGVLFGVAEIQRGQIRERQAAGIAVAKAKGVYKGRKKGTQKANPQRARDLREQGLK